MIIELIRASHPRIAAIDHARQFYGDVLAHWSQVMRAEICTDDASRAECDAAMRARGAAGKSPMVDVWFDSLPLLADLAESIEFRLRRGCIATPAECGYTIAFLRQISRDAKRFDDEIRFDATSE